MLGCLKPIHDNAWPVLTPSRNVHGDVMMDDVISGLRNEQVSKGFLKNKMAAPILVTKIWSKSAHISAKNINKKMKFHRCLS